METFLKSGPHTPIVCSQKNKQTKNKKTGKVYNRDVKKRKNKKTKNKKTQIETSIDRNLEKFEIRNSKFEIRLSNTA